MCLQEQRPWSLPALSEEGRPVSSWHHRLVLTHREPPKPPQPSTPAPGMICFLRPPPVCWDGARGMGEVSGWNQSAPRSSRQEAVSGRSVGGGRCRTQADSQSSSFSGCSPSAV